MRAILALLLFFPAASLSKAASAGPHWCSITNEGYSDCSFVSQDQCRASVSGNGGSCRPEAPVGHRQPRAADARPIPRDTKLDTLLDQLNRKSDKLILCRGC